MKAQCERCKEIVALDFEARPGGMEVRCASCGASYFVAETRAAAAAPTGAAAVATPAAGMVCPKCGEPQPHAEACRRCGLVLTRWTGAAAAASASDPVLDEAREATALWSACEQGWEDPAAHDAFLAHCQKAGVVGFAAARYRAARAARGADDPVCRARLAQIRAIAEFMLLKPARAEAEEASPYRGLVLLLAVLLVAMLALAVYGLVRDRGNPPRRPVAAVAAPPRGGG